MRKFITLFILMLSLNSVNSKAELNIYGYFQIFGQSYDYYNTAWDAYNLSYTNHFAFQQMNLFVANDFGDNFSAVVNLEFIDDYNSYWGLGTMEVSEAYMLYDAYDGLLKVKAGLFIPKFGYLSEIANKTPLLPYIKRPVAFETEYTYMIGRPFYPEKGNLQVYGDYDLTDNVTLNYSAFMGSMAYEFWNLEKNRQQTPVLQYGGRLGTQIDLDLATLELGGSFAMDQDSLTGYGWTPRNKIGVDVGLSVWDLVLRAEYLMSAPDIPDEIQNTLDSLNNAIGTPADMDKMSYYVSLTYNATDNIYINGFYTEWEDHTHPIFFGGLKAISFGAGYKISDYVTLKYQFHNFIMPKEGVLILDKKVPQDLEDDDAGSVTHQIAISVVF